LLLDAIDAYSSLHQRDRTDKNQYRFNNAIAVISLTILREKFLLDQKTGIQAPPDRVGEGGFC
jgi:hypothetical protein